MTKRDQDKVDPTLLALLLEAVRPELPPAALRARILSRAKTVQQDGELNTIRAGESGWKPLIPGVDFKLLVYDVVSQSKSFLLRARAGTRLPEHGHHAYEECLVLQGEFHLGDLTLRAGDFHGASNGAIHGEAWTETDVLIYLRGSIHDYPGIAP